MRASPSLFVLPVLALLAHGACAQADPTRPSAAWVAAQQPGGAAQEQPGRDGHGTQAVVAGAGRRFVIVDGHTVHPGETYRGAKLVSVGPEGAVWQRGKTRETLTLSPNVEKSAVQPASAARRGAANERQHKADHGGEGR